ncbi:hypothetical protein L195_g015810 [Trifolium pratense]|uniref:ER membrane protein complex subunit 2 n=1 Tax=Trifolium pratense TaxID=57577 RepID=A0A2K3MPE1_TRIPR|nr:hypothetical protein L195_g015810 [Trifolium pratense]
MDACVRWHQFYIEILSALVISESGLYKGSSEVPREQKSCTKNATLTTVYILVNISLKAGWRQCCLKQTGPGTMAEKAYTSLLEDNPLDQVLYTLGGLENVQTAKKYYALTIDLTGGKNTRALFGICLACALLLLHNLQKGRTSKIKKDRSYNL